MFAIVEVRADEVELTEVGRTRVVELIEEVIVESEVEVVEFMSAVEVEVESGAVELVRIIVEVVVFEFIIEEVDIPVLLLAVVVAFIPVEVGKGEVIVELPLPEVGIVVFVFPSLPAAHEMFIDGEAA